jgi:DNA segregation ATPase FtsK/SpoIIIE-like protein
MPSKTPIDRPPRIQPQLPMHEFDLPAPPNKGGEQQGLLELLLPLVTVLGFVLMALSGQGRNMLMVVPMGGAMIGSIYFSFRRLNQNRREYEEALARYHQQLGNSRQEMQRYHQLQRDYYRYNYPDVTLARDIAAQNTRSRLGSRLWERRPSDPDFGLIRLGIGTRPSTVIYKPNSSDQAGISDEALRISSESRFVGEVPITLQLRAMYEPRDGKDDDKPRRNANVEVRHSLAIYSQTENKQQRHKEVYGYVNSLLLHYTTFHAPNEARLYVVGTKAAKPHWEWAENLPHANPPGSFPLLCFEGEQIRDRDGLSPRLPSFWKNLRTLLQVRQQRIEDKESGDVTLPFLLVVVDMLELEDSTLADIEKQEAVSTILWMGQKLGAAIIFLVDQPTKIPSSVTSLIELQMEATVAGRAFRYLEVGLNTPRFVGSVKDKEDFVNDTDTLRAFVETLSRLEMREGSASTLVNALDLLEMYGVDKIDSLQILDNWRRSRDPAFMDWPRVKIGYKTGNEIRELVFSASGDGVHGLIAGTTGSGKSELLLTLIVGLAINYDPSIVNFVLVDFKGGAAFEEFRSLPHCVDIVTNLEGNAVERMFSSIKAELNRRSEMLRDYHVEHIIAYRRKNYHQQDPDPADFPRQANPPKAQPFPHLFIIIDEFAEMVTENPEFKAQLDSITRLGRAIGVSLILATQRPAGMVTDQMRANMKFKICLRVETPDDSREILRRADAAYLPNSIPGRAYLQVGNELPEMIQVARAGGTYRPPQEIFGAQTALPVAIWVGRQKQSNAAEKKLSATIVDTMYQYATDRLNGIAKQRKSWPDPLPKYLPLYSPLNDLPGFDVKYLIEQDKLYLNPNYDEARNNELMLNADLEAWFAGRGQWRPLNWKTHGMKAVVGIIDHPLNAEQRLLKLDFTQGHVAIFGAGGWGKTTFLRSLVTTLIANHSPDDLHLYILDFGGQNFTAFKQLPHVGAVIIPEESDRLKRLVRYLVKLLDSRSKRLAKAGADSFIAYNSRNDVQALPAVLVVIDNFAEIRENFEDLLPVFVTLLREGRNVGVYFAASGDMPNSMSGKIYNQFNVRLALKLADKSEYTNIIGRGGTTIGDIWGRGLIAVEREISQEPLEFQIAAPVALTPDEMWAAKQSDDKQFSEESQEAPLAFDPQKALFTLGRVMTERLTDLFKKMRAAYSGVPADLEPIGVLEPYIYLPELLKTAPAAETAITAYVGREDDELQPLGIALTENPHFIVMGPPLSGRTNFLRVWVMALAMRCTPEQVSIILFDPQDRLATYRGKKTFADIPHVLSVVTQPKQIKDVLAKLEFEYKFVRPTSPEDAIQQAKRWHDVAKELAERSEKRLEKLKTAMQQAEDELHQARESLMKAQGEGVQQAKLSVLDKAVGDAEKHFNQARVEFKAEEKVLAEAKALIPETIAPLPMMPRREVYVFVDNFDDFDDLVGRSDDYKLLGDLARNHRRDGLHFILCGTEDLTRNSSDLRKQVTQSRFGFALKSTQAVEKLGGRLRRDMRDLDLPSGRGFIVRAGISGLAQIATLEPPGEGARYEQQLDKQIDDLSREHKRAGWYYDLVPESIRKLYQRAKDEGLEAESDFVPAEIEVPDYASQRAENQRNPLKELLSAKNLQKLDANLLNTLVWLGLELGGASVERLWTAPVSTIQALIDGGEIHLPPADAISDDVLAAIQQRIEVVDILTPDLLKRLPLELYSQLNIAVPLDELRQANPSQLKLDIAQGKLALPARLEPELKAQLERFSEYRKLLTGKNLVMLTPQQLRDLNMAFPVPPEQLYEYPAEKLQEAIDNGALALPILVSEELLKAIKDRIRVYGELSGKVLVKLPESLLHELGVRGMPPNLDADTVQQMINRGEIELPATLSKEGLQAVRKANMPKPRNGN